MWCSAFESPTQSRVVVVAFNDSTTSSYTETFNLSGLSVPVVAPWLSNATTDLVQQPLVSVSGNSFSYTIPPRSGVCFVGDIQTGTPTRTSTNTPSPTHSPTATASPTKVPTPDACQYVAAVNCGSTVAYTSSGLGLTFKADQAYVIGSAPGSVGSFGYTSTGDTALATTATFTGDSGDATLFNTQYYGPTVTYDFSVPNGPAYVTLYWAETYATAPGQRVFNVSIDGMPVETGLDLYAVAGLDATYVRTYPVTVTNGLVSIVMTATTNNAVIQGISVQAGNPCTPSPTRSQTWTPSRTPTTTQSSSQTATGTATPSKTPSATGSPTVSATSSASASPMVSLTPSPSFSASLTFTWSSSPTPSACPTSSLTVTPSVTATATPTLSATLTESGTPSQTPTAIVTTTATVSVGVASSPTAKETVRVTATSSATPTPTSLPNGTAAPTFTAFPTGTPSSGPLVIQFTVPVPNPNPSKLYLDMAGPGERVDVRVFTAAFVLVGHRTSPVRLVQGWSSVDLGDLFQGLPRGLYFVEVTAGRGGVTSAPSIAKVFLTR